MKIIISIFLCLMSLSQAVFSQPKPASDAAFVWIEPTGEGRQVYAYFRNEFELTDLPKMATIQLYAASRYSLMVNGQFMNFGPIRSYQKHPYYDTVELTPFLKKGKNTIAVKVLANGMETFQVPFGNAGFVAFGNIESGLKNISLKTPGNWICRKATGYNQLSPRFSFAQGPIEVFDARLEADDWKGEIVQSKLWKKPVLLKNQSAFGPLLARTIPLLTNNEIEPKFVVNRLNLSTEDDIYNWNANDDPARTVAGSNQAALTYTYLFSPEDKEIEIGVSWGNFWLNGQKIQTVGVPKKAFRSNGKVQLKQGWNLFFARQEIIWSAMDGMLALPKNAGIELSVNKKHNDPIKIRLAAPLSKTENALTGDRKSAVENPESLPVKWINLTGKEDFVNPAKELAWLNVDRIKADPYQSTNLRIPAGKSHAVTYNFGSMQLGRIFIDVDAPEGTIFDLTWSEDLADSVVTLYKRIEVTAVARLISRSGKQHFETFRPYGLRYLQVTVRNHKEDVTLHKAGVYRQVFPYQKKGSFSCSDPLMNDIWELGWRTIQVCSEDSYTDTPFRERGHYAGDFFPEFATTLATSGDSRLAKQTIRLFIDKYEAVYKSVGIPDYGDFPLINILVASWYIRQFNDTKFAEELYPTFAPFFENMHSKRGTDGFYHSKNAFIEWISMDKNSDLTAFQTLVCACFHEMSKMAILLGKNTDADKFEAWSNETKQFMQTNLWDAKAGNFVDGIKNGVVLPTRFPGSSAFPSVWNIPTAEQEKNIQDGFKDVLLNIGPSINRLQKSTPYGGFYALASLYQQENTTVAEQYMRKNWGKMVLDVNDLTWEDFNRDSKSTMSHAWASSPTYYLSTQVLGVDLGFPSSLSPDTIYIRPQSESLSWAKGTVPHPKGLVAVEWKVIGSNLFLNYSAPEGVPVIVKPRGRLAGYVLNINKE